jgi:putative membrane protein
MSNHDFSIPQRQSVKGIVIIFGFQLFKFLRQSFALIFLAIFSFVRKGDVFGMSFTQIILITILVLVIFLITSVVRYLYFKFYISGEGFHLDTGLINKERTVIPRSKIQNIHIKQNVLQQLINVVAFSIETAGDNKSEIEIKALDRATALAMKKSLLKQKILDETVSEKEDEIYFKVSFRKLLLEGVGQNHLKSMAIILAFISGIYFQIKDIIEGASLEDQFLNDVKGNVDYSSFFSVILFNTIILVGFLILAFLFSLVKTLIVNYNLQVIEHNQTIEISKGLLNKISVNLHPSRIQNIIITHNRIKRYFGLYTLEAKQAMTDQKKAQNLSIIALSKEQINYLTQKLYQGFVAIDEKFKPSFYFIRIKIIQSVVILIGLNIGMFFSELINLWVLNILLIPMLYLFVITTYRKANYGVNDNFLMVESGFIETKTQIVQHHKIQSVVMYQSYFMKRRGVASLYVYNASGNVTLKYIQEATARQVHNFLLYKVETTDKNWM